MTGIGIIGCGVISGIYLSNIARLPGLALRVVADARPEVAQETGERHGVDALSVETLLARDDIDIVVNLTVPAAHAPVGRQVLEAGKHLYLEKPLSATLEEARDLMRLATDRGLRVGCAPDTFLGGGQQAARAALDSGRIGEAIGGTVTMMVPGHERWHPNPDFYYSAPGGGPVMDMGPYYLTALINLIGPVREVAALAARPRSARRIATGPRAGQSVPVEVDTHVVGVLAFQSGALVQIAMSFDIAGHWHSPIELYGTDGSMRVPDRNRFDGTVDLSDGTQLPAADRPYGANNWRGLGLADMAAAIAEDRDHRASGALALHVLEIIDALDVAARTKQTQTLHSGCDRPQPIEPEFT